MKVSLNWLKDYVSAGIPPAKLAHKLTMAGLEVKKIEKVGSDIVFELEITPNRPDCLNMIGISREAAAILNKSYELPKFRKFQFPQKKCGITISDKKGCPRYIGTIVEDVSVSQTPKWIKNRITSLGMRSINNVVDITNFCLQETGQPLHAFDYDKLIGGEIIVRRAQKGERIVTIDGVERELDSSILVIADQKRPVAIAGIMGGAETEVSGTTKRILLESAYFDPILIRQASRKLGLTSESSYRFERGVDYDMVELGANRALSLILQQAQGVITARSDVLVSKKKASKKKIVISLEQINSCLGASLTTAQCRNVFKRLDFDVAINKSGIFQITPPLFRADIQEEVDLIEEIARIIGYDKLPLSLPRIKSVYAVLVSTRDFKKCLRQILISRGFNEVITYSMVNQKFLEQSNQSLLKGIRIKNPLTQDQEMMRPSLLPSLLSIVQSNLNRKQMDVNFFELGKIYTGQEEKETMGLIATGSNSKDWRELQEKEVAFYDMKGVVEQIFEKMGVRERILFEAKEQTFLEKGECASIFKDDKEIGVVGKIAEDVLKDWDIKQKNIFFAQIDLDEFLKQSWKKDKYKPVVEYPSIVYDVSLAVKEDVYFQKVKDVAFQAGSEILSAVQFKEQYLGNKIPQGYRGLIFSLTYQSKDRTLREEEACAIHTQITQAFVDQLGAIVR